MEQTHRVGENRINSMEEGKYYTAIFINVDKVWHTELIQKLKPLSSKRLYLVIMSYLLYTKIKNATFSIKKIHTGMPQRSVLDLILYFLFKADINYSPNRNTIYIFADQTDIINTNKIIEIATLAYKIIYVNQQAKHKPRK